jgi:hypothetical protein
LKKEQTEGLFFYFERFINENMVIWCYWHVKPHKDQSEETLMTLKVLNDIFAVCKLSASTKIPFESPYIFWAKTDEEISLVCPESVRPSECTEYESGWKAFRIEGVLDFSLIGIIAKISTILAENRVGIFVVSTFNTDYVLIKSEQFAVAMDALKGAGYKVAE